MLTVRLTGKPLRLDLLALQKFFDGGFDPDSVDWELHPWWGHKDHPRGTLLVGAQERIGDIGKF